MSVLSLENIYYRYENAQKYVLKDLNAQFEEGKFIAVVGKSGAGKSTFLSLLAGLDSPTKGKVLFKGEDIAKGSYSNHRRDHICLVFQNYNLIDYLTPLENVKLVNEKADKEILLKLGLGEELIHRNVLKLSGGQQQRVALARTLAQNPEIILADEPVAALDPVTAKRVMEDFKRINKEMNISILLNIHHVELALEYADRILGIRDGEIVYDGPSSEVTPEVLDLIYKGKVEGLNETK